jgi:hypothetical protein
MHKTPIAEWLLARIAGCDRAAAIMGDLLELSATRGRLWFWTAYARTLISLGWRAPVAFVFAMASMRFIFGTVFPWLWNRRTTHLMDAGLFGVYNQHIRLITWNISMVTAQFLCFAFAFVLVRFGWRNRLTQLACALFLIAMPIYSLRPWFMDLSGVAMMLIIAAALVAPPWRKPLAVLAGTCLPAIAVKGTYLILLTSLTIPYHRKVFALRSWVNAYDAISFVLAAIVCLYLYRWLLQRPLASDRTIA